jgi:Tol biopolymer transport system component
LRNAVTLGVAFVCVTAATPITPASAGQRTTTNRTTGSITIQSIVGAPSGSFTQGNDASRAPSASSDGRYVAFESDATDLVPNDTNDSTDVFLRDNLTLAVTRVSALLANGKQTNDDSYDATISADGSKVAYVSNADGITSDDHNGGGDAYVYDTHAHTVVRASVASGYPGGNLDGNDDGIDYTTQAAISADGNWLAFTTDNGLSIVDGNGDNDVYLRDLVHNTTIRLSNSRTGDPDGGGGEAAAPSSDACEIAYSSTANDIVARDTNMQPDVFVYDRCNRSKVTTSSQKRVRMSVSPAGNQANGPSETPAISANGRYVVFASKATNLVAPTVTGNHWQIYLHDRDADGNGVFDEPGTGKTTTTLISATGPGGTSATSDATQPAISADGCVIAFASDAPTQIFTVDRCHGNTRQRITVGTGGATPNGASSAPSFEPDGDQVMFQSDARNLVAPDTNSATDVFAARWRPDTHAPLLANSTVAVPATSSVWVLNTAANNFKPSWSGWDPSGVASYTVDLARFFWNKAGVGTAYAHFYSDTGAQSGVFTASVPGTTYCLRVSAETDGAHNSSSGAGPATCRALPLVATQLSFGSNWTKENLAGAYGGTAYRTTTKGATMTRTFVAADRLALVATTCPTCGTADVYLGKTLLAHVNLASATTQTATVIPLATWSSLHSGTLSLTVTSSGKPVVVQGVGVYQDH